MKKETVKNKNPVKKAPARKNTKAPVEKPPAKKNTNLNLWNQVCESDPETLTTFNRKGKRTAILAQSQIEKATEIFGPYGYKWGLRNLTWGNVTHQDMTLEVTLDAEFFYPVEQNICAGFPIATDMIFESGAETRKKMMTDCTTKALSKLGFNADVFKGEWEEVNGQLVNTTEETVMMKDIPSNIKADAQTLVKFGYSQPRIKSMFLLLNKDWELIGPVLMTLISNYQAKKGNK